MASEVKEDKGEQNEKGFYCEVCDCIVKDSLNYLDHVNGKRHNKNLGISLKKFTDCTLEEVKEMLELKRRQKNEMESSYLDDNDDDEEEDEEAKEKDKEDEQERLRRKRREKKKRQKARKSESLYY